MHVSRPVSSELLKHAMTCTYRQRSDVSFRVLQVYRYINDRFQHIYSSSYYFYNNIQTTTAYSFCDYTAQITLRRQRANAYNLNTIRMNKFGKIMAGFNEVRYAYAIRTMYQVYRCVK